MLGFFLHAQHLAVLVEFHDAKALGILHIVAKHRAAALILCIGGSGLEDLGEAVAVENIIPQDHGAAVVANELFAQDEGLCQAVRGGLHLVLQMDAVLAAVPQQRLKAGRVGGGGNDQDVLNACQHQRGQGVVDHRLVVDRQQLFAGDHGQRVKPGAGTAGKNDTFHICALL